MPPKTDGEKSDEYEQRWKPMHNRLENCKNAAAICVRCGNVTAQAWRGWIAFIVLIRNHFRKAPGLTRQKAHGTGQHQIKFTKALSARRNAYASCMARWARVQIRRGKAAEWSAKLAGARGCSQKPVCIGDRQESAWSPHMVMSGPAVRTSRTARLVLVSCMTNGEQKHVVFLQGSAGAEGCCPSRGPSQQESTDPRISCRAASPAESVAANDVRHRTGHVPITKSIRNEPNRSVIPQSISSRRARIKRYGFACSSTPQPGFPRGRSPTGTS